jgi:hypothetical protein
MPSVPYTEKAFLQLMARRLLRYQRDAEARGEVYHDVSPFSPLQCGIEAKFRFEVAPGGYIPVVLFKRWAQFQPIELQEIAESVLDAPAKLRTSADSVLEYVRATDATT